MSLKINVIFILVDTPTSYNFILGETTINSNKIIASIMHQKMKLVIGNQPVS